MTTTPRPPRPTLYEQEAMANIRRTRQPGRHGHGAICMALVSNGWATWDSSGRWALTDAGDTALEEAAAR